MLDKSRGRSWQFAHFLCFFPKVLSVPLGPPGPRFLKMHRCNILRTLLNRCKKTSLDFNSWMLFQLDAASSSCGALCLQRWDLGNYYTVGGSGRVIPKDPVPASQCLKCRWPPMATNGHFQLINCCRSILEGIQDACKFANCVVHSDLSDDAEVFTSVHRNMFSQGFIQDMLH